MNKNEDVGLLLKQINGKIKKQADKILADFSLTISQARFLGYLNEHKGKCVTQKELQNHFEVSHPTTVGIIKRLEKKGFITTQFDETDKRNKIIELTPKENLIHEEMKAFQEKTQKQLLQGIPEIERENLVRLLKILYKNINE